MTTSLPLHPLLQQAAQIAHLERGSLSIIRQGPDGPYFNHQCRQDGKNVSRYVPRDQVPAVQAALDGYQQFQQCIAAYVDQKVAQTRALIAADSKKKSRPDSRPPLRSPRKPRSKS